MIDDVDDKIPAIYASDAEVFRASVARKTWGDRDLADEVVQETWLRAVLHWRKRGIPDQPAAWLTTVSRNLLFNEFPRRPVARLDDIGPHEIPSMDLGAVSESADTDAAVQAALVRLPPAERRLLEQFHFERVPVAQIAASLEVSERAVEGRLRRARLKLRDELQGLQARLAAYRTAMGPQGVGPASKFISIGKGLLMTALLPLLLAIAVFPLSLLVQRIPRRRLGILRIFAGAAMITLATTSARHPRPLQVFGLGIMVWGVWMLRPQAVSETSV